MHLLQSQSLYLHFLLCPIKLPIGMNQTTKYLFKHLPFKRTSSPWFLHRAHFGVLPNAPERICSGVKFNVSIILSVEVADVEAILCNWKVKLM